MGWNKNRSGDCWDFLLKSQNCQYFIGYQLLNFLMRVTFSMTIDYVKNIVTI